MIRASYEILKKDLKSEIRNRYVINSLLMFVIIVITIIRFSIGDEKISSDVLSGLLWIAIFFTSSSGLARVFIKEEEKETSAALKMTSPAASIFIGKLFFNFILTFSLNIVISLLFVIITGFEIKNPEAFIPVLLLGNTGLVASSTIIAAIISKANSKGTLYPVLSFPVLLPLLIAVIDGTKLAAEGAVLSEVFADLQILLSYSVVIIVASLFLFRFIWED
ncbi:MAG TPA: heme exporter protein CcmB [Ignavibacteria bacterium]|nr:heme exporter protein CcmB [Ignavibacteria bacterium]